jgi:hypothetical protein
MFDIKRREGYRYITIVKNLFYNKMRRKEKRV